MIILNSYRVTTQLTRFVLLYSCDNITQKMVPIAAETCCWENCD